MSVLPTVQLGELCTVVAGGTPSRTEASYFGGDIPWVKIGDMLQGVITKTEESITKAGLENCSAKMLPAGTVLISIFATIGRTALLAVQATTNQAIAGVIPRDSSIIQPAYLQRYLNFLAPSLERRARGVAQANLNSSILKSLPIPLPPIPEQRRIADILDRTEALRAKRRAALTLLDRLPQSIFIDMFGDHDKWPSARLDAVTTFIDYRGISPNKQPSGVRLVTARNIKRGWFEEEPQEFIPADEYVSWMRRGMPRTGDVLFTTEGHTLGSAAQLPHFQKVALAQRLIAIQPGVLLCSEYLLQVVLGREFQDEVYRRATGSAARGISSKQLAEITLKLPPIVLQQEFARRVAAVERMQASQRSALAKLDELFAGLQHRAFRGEL